MIMTKVVLGSDEWNSLLLSACQRIVSRGKRTGPKVPIPPALQALGDDLDIVDVEPEPNPIMPRLCPTRVPKLAPRRKGERKVRYENRVSDDAVRDYFHANARIRELLNQ